jgi:hypothetical protein
MSREELERFLTDEGRAAVARFVSESQQEDNKFDIDEALDRNLYEAIAHYDSRAGLSRWLSLRFTGHYAEGRMAGQAVEDILSGFRREVEGAGTATTRAAGLFKLDLVGFSSGSAILHFAPSETSDLDPGDDSAEGQQSLLAESDQIDEALGVVTDLHAAAENGSDMLRFSGQDALLRGFKALSDALDKYSLDMEVTWRGRTGQRRTARLSSQGRDYARPYLDRSEITEDVTVTGRVVELDISGSFDVKTGSASNSPRYKIATGSEESLLGLRLELGQTVRVRVRKRTDRNKVGVIFAVRYEFLNLAPEATLT